MAFDSIWFWKEGIVDVASSLLMLATGLVLGVMAVSKYVCESIVSNLTHEVESQGTLDRRISYSAMSRNHAFSAGILLSDLPHGNDARGSKSSDDETENLVTCEAFLQPSLIQDEC